jgi:hypothetical protein
MSRWPAMTLAMCGEPGMIASVIERPPEIMGGIAQRIPVGVVRWPDRARAMQSMLRTVLGRSYGFCAGPAAARCAICLQRAVRAPA